MSNLLDKHLKGRRITAFVIAEHSSALEVEGGYTINIEGLCRYVGLDGDFVVTADHGRFFGLQVPYDAETAIKNLILGEVILTAAIKENSHDVALQLAKGTLEIICTSTGYEIAQLRGPDDLIVVMRHE